MYIVNVVILSVCFFFLILGALGIIKCSFNYIMEKDKEAKKCSICKKLGRN